MIDERWSRKIPGFLAGLLLLGGGGPGLSRAAEFHTGEQVPFSADYRTWGALTRTEIKGRVLVGDGILRLDMDRDPDDDDRPFSLLYDLEKDDLWRLDVEKKTYESVLSHHWAPKLLPRWLKARPLARAVEEGTCPLGRVRDPEDCRSAGSEKVGEREASRWTFKRREIWLDPRLRVALREVFKPFFRKDDTQSVELTKVEEGPPPAAMLVIPADYTCADRDGTCEGAPVSGSGS